MPKTWICLTVPTSSPRRVKAEKLTQVPQNGFCSQSLSSAAPYPLLEEGPCLFAYRHHQHIDTQVKLAACQARKKLIGVTNIDRGPGTMLGLGDTAEDRQRQIPIKPHEVRDACLAQRGRGPEWAKSMVQGQSGGRQGR